MSTPADPTTTQPRRRLSRKTTWILGGSVAAAAIVAAITIPLLSAQAAHRDAAAGYADALTAASTAATAAKTAATAVDDAKTSAGSEADALQALLDATPAELVDPATTRDQLATTIQAVRDAASADAPTIPAEGAWSKLGDDATTEQLVDATASASDYATKTTALADTFDQVVDALTTRVDDAHTALDALAAAAAAKGATLGYDQAGEGERQALTAALAALTARTSGEDRPSTSDTAAQLSAYVAAAGAAKASHDAAIAAAEQNSNSGGNGGSAGGGSMGGSRSGGSGGSSGGSSGGNGGSSGGSSGGGSGGSSGGGGTGGSSGPSCSGNQENACVKTPPTFSTNGNYVGYDPGICSYYTEHNVGYGGNSRDGSSFSFPWSATVSGPTVTYYVCG